MGALQMFKWFKNKNYKKKENWEPIPDWLVLNPHLVAHLLVI